ncbi:UDP-3-O-[3-hydroxymyristoyl] N-acetylglucosamine deacetylase [Candidatus Blochmanniella vafra str. BVAF]|uniref:UDP-3-O-acyl-N-acetylglucosamine deacetylase n=1 Tax=Blochmanniella vafra (strain BVAF) TaxID=859654 RepID=E8Q5Q8_BLOVB|nr:UDP-3-O-acyl-N-acetylglucosamine deacetylase [Candidatus Blochmannia vafer]ADV33555.1 UDP-3-O-[3-hydroxymyristoyl] N-acetylglucosamine deacetylase [Candidatus Blochmannia vafer str. BVAF]
MLKQRTLKKITRIAGVGLHTGRLVTATLYPALANTGVIYRRIDLKPSVDFNVNIESVGNTTLCTCLRDEYGIHQVCTIEHLNAALSGLGIDNIIVELDASEVPIMDGSANPFVSLLMNAGVQELNVSKKFFKLKQIVRVEEKDKWAELKPHDGFTLDFTIEYKYSMMEPICQHYFFNFSTQSFIAEISAARTFGFINRVKDLKNRGFILGGDLNSVVVIGNNSKVLNIGGLRFDNELVRHKVLDAIGDLFVCGYNMLGSFSAFKSGHSLHNKLLRTVLSCQESWEIISCIE